MSGRWNPLSLTTIPSESTSEIPFLLMAPFVGPLPLSLLNARLLPAIVSTLSVLFLFLFVRNSLSQEISLLVGLVAAISPHAVFAGRTAFDAPLSQFFFVLSLYLLSTLKSKKILFCSIPLTLAFYSYIATKTIFIPFVLFSTFFFWHQNQRQFGRYYLGLLLISLVIFIIYLANLSKIGRLQEISLPSSPAIKSQVDSFRPRTLFKPIAPITINKYTIFTKSFIDKYIKNFSPEILFSSGDHTYLISLWHHGYLYYVDLILMIVGILFLFKNHSKFLLFITALILLAPLPEAVRSDPNPSYAFHSILQYPFFYILIASGIFYLPRAIYPAVTVVYLLSVFNFTDIYFFRYPVYQSEGFFFSNRILSKYLYSESQKSASVYLMTPEPYNALRQYLFYNNLYTQQNFDEIAKIFSRKPPQFTFTNLYFFSDFAGLSNVDKILKNSTLIVPEEFRDPKFKDLKPLSIKRLSDGKTMFHIYNSQTCQNSTGPNNPTDQLSLATIGPETLSSDSFCQYHIYHQ